MCAQPDGDTECLRTGLNRKRSDSRVQHEGEQYEKTSKDKKEGTQEKHSQRLPLTVYKAFKTQIHFTL